MYLEISVDHSQCVQVLNTHCDLSPIEASPLLREDPLS